MSPLLDLQGVAVARGRRAVLRDVSLTVTEGEVIALIGPNGAGKTTLLQLVVGARRPDHGTIRGRGHALVTIADRSPLMAWVADDAEPPPELTVERVLHYASPGSALLPALLDPLQLRPVLSSRCGRLSRGERRRVVLAEALLLDRPLVVLDEPFGAFDPLQLREIIAEIRRLAQGGTAFLISIHQLEQAVRVADRVIVLHEGRMAASGSEQELRTIAGQPTGSLDDVLIAILGGATPRDAA